MAMGVAQAGVQWRRGSQWRCSQDDELVCHGTFTFPTLGLVHPVDFVGFISSTHGDVDNIYGLYISLQRSAHGYCRNALRV